MKSGATKLFRVTLRGLSNYNLPNYKETYVLADTPTEAYEKVYKFVKENNLGFDCDRELHSVELVAEANEYTTAPYYLFV